MTTQPKKSITLDEHLAKLLKEAEKNGVTITELPYKDRVRIHATAVPPKKK